MKFILCFVIVFGILLLVVPLNPLKREEEEKMRAKKPDADSNGDEQKEECGLRK